MKGQQESLTTVVIKQAGHPVPASSSMPGSRPGLWQTATVSTGAHRQKDGSMTDKLDQQVKSWATPRAGKTTDENPETWALRQAKGDVATMPLTAQVKQSWPTPSADGDSRPGANADPVKWQQIADAKKAQGINKQLFLTTKVAMQQSGKLNPRWVETLMGLPVGWTMPSCASPVTIERMSSDSSETVLSQQQQNEPSGL